MYDILAETKAKYRNNRNVAAGCLVVSILLGFIAVLYQHTSKVIPESISGVFILLGLLFYLFLGVLTSYSWTKYKSLNKWYSLLGIIIPIGFLLLAIIPDKNPVEHR